MKASRSAASWFISVLPGDALLLPLRHAGEEGARHEALGGLGRGHRRGQGRVLWQTGASSPNRRRSRPTSLRRRLRSGRRRTRRTGRQFAHTRLDRRRRLGRGFPILVPVAASRQPPQFEPVLRASASRLSPAPAGRPRSAAPRRPARQSRAAATARRRRAAVKPGAKRLAAGPQPGCLTRRRLTSEAPKHRGQRRPRRNVVVFLRRGKTRGLSKDEIKTDAGTTS